MFARLQHYLPRFPHLCSKSLAPFKPFRNRQVLEIGDGICDSGNNNELCAYDGGDCCSCTRVTKLAAWEKELFCDGPLDASDFADSGCQDPNAPCFGEENPLHDYGCSGVPWGQQGPLPTVDGAVEVGTNTDVGVSATGSAVFGCGRTELEQCAPTNTRDGISSESRSMWTCASIAVDAEGPCQIEYTFGEPQDIVDIQVAFWEGNKLTRTLEVRGCAERKDILALPEKVGAVGLPRFLRSSYRFSVVCGRAAIPLRRSYVAQLELISPKKVARRKPALI